MKGKNTMTTMRMTLRGGTLRRNLKTLSDIEARRAVPLSIGCILALTAAYFILLEVVQHTLMPINITLTPFSASTATSKLTYALVLENADRNIAKRRAWLFPSHRESKTFGKLQVAMLWHMFQPAMPCLWYMEKHPSASVQHYGGVCTQGSCL